MGSHTTDEHAAFTHVLDEDFRQAWGRSAAAVTFYDVYSEEQAAPPYGANVDAALSDVFEAGTNVLTQVAGFGHQVFLFHEAQHGQSGGGRDRASCKGVEEHVVLAEFVEQFSRGDYGADRMSIAHRFAHRYEFGFHAEHLVAPHAGSGAAEARLHLVGDDEASCGTDAGGDALDVAGGRLQKPLGGEEGVKKECRDAVPRGLK